MSERWVGGVAEVRHLCHTPPSSHAPSEPRSAFVALAPKSEEDKPAIWPLAVTNLTKWESARQQVRSGDLPFKLLPPVFDDSGDRWRKAAARLR